MDGSSHDRIARGEGLLLRDYSPEEAAEDYWMIVYMLITRQATPHVASSADNRNAYLYLMKDSLSKVKEVTEHDFSLINSVASKLRQYPVFRTQPLSDTKGRIQAELVVVFSDD